MKKFVKLNLVVIIFCMLLTSISFGQGYNSKYDSKYKVLDLTQRNNSIDKDVKNIAKNLKEFNKDKVSEYVDVDVIKISYKRMKNVNADKIKQLIDNGSSLVVIGEDANFEAVANYLTIPLDIEAEVNNADIFGVSLFRQNNEYIFSFLSVAYLETDNAKKTFTKEEFENFSYSDKIIPSHLRSRKNSFETANKIKASIVPHDALKTQIPSANFFKYFSNNTYIPDTGKTGDPDAYSVTITQYTYDIARFEADGVEKDLWDVVSDVYVDGEPGYSVSYYEVQMRANWSNHEVLGATWLQSNTSQTVSLGSSVGINSDGVISGSVSSTTSYTYNANSQEIDNNFPAGDIKTWKMDPVNNKEWDKTYNTQPGIRFVNNNPNNLASPYSAAYTKIIDLKGYRNELIDVYLTLLPEYQFEVGGYWHR